MLSHEEDKKTNLSKESKALFSGPKPKTNFNAKQNEQKRSYNNFEKKIDKKTEDTAYCLFSNSGESFLAMQDNEKKTIYLAGISHPNKNTFHSKKANIFINNEIKKKKVFLNIIEKKDNGDIVAEVFLDELKKNSLNKMLIDEGLAASIEINTTEIPTDMQIIETKENILNSSIKQKNTFEHSIGYLVNHGEAPYQNNVNNSKSYFIEIEVNEEKQVKWGIDFKRAIKAANVNIGDYIELKKEDTIQLGTGSKTKNKWIIIKKEDINQIHARSDGPPILDSIPITNEVDEVIPQDNRDWESYDYIDWDQEQNLPPPDYNNHSEIDLSKNSNEPPWQDYSEEQDNLIVKKPSKNI